MRKNFAVVLTLVLAFLVLSAPAEAVTERQFNKLQAQVSTLTHQVNVLKTKIRHLKRQKVDVEHNRTAALTTNQRLAALEHWVFGCILGEIMPVVRDGDYDQTGHQTNTRLDLADPGEQEHFRVLSLNEQCW
jgi:outer membrane murein-binding lipoprotein Lpp